MVVYQGGRRGRTSDPGEQLSKNSSFVRDRKRKWLLFKEFKNVESWRELLRSLLLRRLFREIGNQPVIAKEEQAKGSARTQEPVTDSEAVPKSPSKPGPGFTFLADLIEEAAGKVRSKELLGFDRTGALPAASTARLLLFAATNYDWNSQHIEFGAHEINSMYLPRGGPRPV